MSDHPRQRLESWKDIAAYLKRDVSTVQRWEKREGMPVHRHQHDKLGSVYAFPAELDEWMRSRRASPERVPQPAPSRRRRVLLVMALAVTALAVVLVTASMLRRGDANPLATARFVRLTDFEGSEHAAAISRDGRFVAFLSDRDGPTDVWVTQVGSGQFVNLTKGKLHELLNPDIRLLGFSPDGALVTMWVRRQSETGKPDISIWAVPTLGGEPRLYREGAAELDWSRDGTRLAYHTPATGDPIFLHDRSGAAPRQVFAAPEGIHNHYLTWSPDDRFIYFVFGQVPSENDLWRLRADGGQPERLTSHNTRVSHPTFLDGETLLYLATDTDGGGPWLHALDVGRAESRRISSGVERYTSVAASADGRHVAATVANPRRTLWRVSIGDGAGQPKEAARVAVPIVGGRSPRSAPGYLLYVSSRSDGESIWKLSGSSASELWSTSGARVLGGPAIARDGKQIAFAAENRGRARLYVINADGSGLRAIADAIEPRGEPAWSPDGMSLAVAATVGGAPRLLRIDVPEQKVATLLSGFAANPAWSPDGASIVFSGAEVGTTFPIRSMGLDGRIRPEPSITMSRGTRRVAFLPRENAIVVLRGDLVHKNFWAIDIATGRERRLTDFGAEFVIGDFDVSSDGREIVFDRQHDDSDVVLIERK